MNIIQICKNNIFILLNYPKLFLYKVFYYLILNKIFSKKIDCTLNIKGYKITIPNDITPFIILDEIFVYEEYKKLKKMKCILDLGGFLGESAIYLAHNNRKVVTLEPDPENFKYLVKNVSSFSNIEYYNAAVVNKKTHQFYYKSNKYDYGGNLYNLYDKKHKIEIKTIEIKELIDKYKPDGIKIDVEGAEFEIIEFFIKNDKFPFIKGYIEFHFEGKTDKIYIFKKFIKFLKKKGYIYEIYKNHKKESLSKIFYDYYKLKNKEYLIFILYFERTQKIKS